MRREKCWLCNLNPRIKKNAGRQLYCCEACKCVVCSDCAEDGDSKEFAVPNPVICKPCHHERQELKAEQAGLR